MAVGAVEMARRRSLWMMLAGACLQDRTVLEKLPKHGCPSDLNDMFLAIEKQDRNLMQIACSRLGVVLEGKVVDSISRHLILETGMDGYRNAGAVIQAAAALGDQKVIGEQIDLLIAIREKEKGYAPESPSV